MKFKLKTHRFRITDEELLNDLRRIAKLNGKNTVTRDEYSLSGNYSYSAVSTRFSNWNTALKQAGLEISKPIRIGKTKLFINMKNVWLLLGRQPVCADMDTEISGFNSGIYRSKFGTWKKALEEFVKYANKGKLLKEPSPYITSKMFTKNKTKRRISKRLRFEVLERDSFRCVKCGSSPAISRGVELHIDHITPYSKGGETILENLETLCIDCNLGKGTGSK